MVHVDIDNESVRSARHYIKMVALGELLGCSLIGPAGMGKTHLVEHTLTDMNVEYVKFGGHITLAGIYEFMYEHRDKLIFFDDVSQVINEAKIMELLKQALNTSQHSERVLHYRSKGVLEQNIPNHFTFEGRCIFAFNVADRQNGNVKAIFDRAPLLELRYTLSETLDAMDKIARSPGHDLTEQEKLVVTHEIKKHVDSTMDVSLRKQASAFTVFRGFKRLYGPNNKWVVEVQKLFGKKKESWIRELVRELVGSGSIKRVDLVKEIAVRRDMSPRTAQRKINEYLSIGEIFQNKDKFSDISVLPFK